MYYGGLALGDAWRIKFNRIFSKKKRLNCSNMTVAMKKNGGKSVESVTLYNIRYMERP